MKAKIQEKQGKVGQLLRQVKAKPNVANEIEKAVREALQKARRNINHLQKTADGIFKVKNKP